jgi:UDP-N-acetylmuramoyl-L-alanyl-D-glutamate--2,6-diaminopimelate ligase
MKLSEVIEKIDILDVTGDLTGDVSSICFDSRSCGPDSLFVAIAGLKTDGHDYIAQALAGGARFIVHEKTFALSPEAEPSAVIKVSSSRRALGILGKNFYHHPSSRLCLIGVTGTNGKTTITYLMESIFKAAGFSAGVLGTVNYRWGGKVLPAPNTTPESFEFQQILDVMVKAGVSHVIAEVSSHAIDLGRVEDGAFDLGIFTNLSQDHLDYHETMERYYEAKKRFFTEILPAGGKRGKHQAVINGDDPWGRRLLREIGSKTGTITFGTEDSCDVKATAFTLNRSGIEALIEAGDNRFQLRSTLIGKFNLYNILAATAAALAVGIAPAEITAGVQALRTVPGRLEKVSDLGQPDVFVDYAHTEDALRKVLQNLSNFKRGKMITVFGCGGDRDHGKRPLMGKAAVELSDFAIVTSDNPRTEDPLSIIADIEAGIRDLGVQRISPDQLPEGAKGYTVIADRKEAIEKALSTADDGDIVLVAGKGHEDYQILGTRKITFDDRAVVREFLAGYVSGRKH